MVMADAMATEHRRRQDIQLPTGCIAAVRTYRRRQEISPTTGHIAADRTYRRRQDILTAAGHIADEDTVGEHFSERVCRRISALRLKA